MVSESEKSFKKLNFISMAQFLTVFNMPIFMMSFPERDAIGHFYNNI